MGDCAVNGPRRWTGSFLMGQLCLGPTRGPWDHHVLGWSGAAVQHSSAGVVVGTSVALPAPAPVGGAVLYPSPLPPMPQAPLLAPSCRLEASGSEVTQQPLLPRLAPPSPVAAWAQSHVSTHAVPSAGLGEQEARPGPAGEGVGGQSFVLQPQGPSTSQEPSGGSHDPVHEGEPRPRESFEWMVPGSCLHPQSPHRRQQPGRFWAESRLRPS